MQILLEFYNELKDISQHPADFDVSNPAALLSDPIAFDPDMQGEKISFLSVMNEMTFLQRARARSPSVTAAGVSEALSSAVLVAACSSSLVNIWKQRYEQKLQRWEKSQRRAYFEAKHNLMWCRRRSFPSPRRLPPPPPRPSWPRACAASGGAARLDRCRRRSCFRRPLLLRRRRR